MGQEQFTLTIEIKDDHLKARGSGERTRESVTAMTLQVFEDALAGGLMGARMRRLVSEI